MLKSVRLYLLKISISNSTANFCRV